jgi:universal stress protein E
MHETVVHGVPSLQSEQDTMEPLRHILVVVDPVAQQSPALAKARQLANAFKASVELLLCDRNPALMPNFYPDAESYTSVVEPVRASHEARLRVLATPFAVDKLHVTCHVDFGRPLHSVILDRVALKKPDLVVKDTHHHSVLRRTLITNTDWHLIRDCPQPLLLVKDTIWSAEPHVSAAVDPGHPQDTPAALDHAVIYAADRIARGLGSQVSLVHCWSPIALYAMGAVGGGMGGVPVMMPPEVIDSQRGLDRERLEHLARVHDIPPARTHLRDGIAADELPIYAAHHGADLLVMGAVSRSGLDRMFIGHTAEMLLEGLPCDIMVVKLPVDTMHP